MTKPAPQGETEAPVKGPQGTRLEGNLGPGTLRPGVGKLTVQTGQPQYCGTMTGLVFGYKTAENKRFPGRMSTSFAGKFILVTHAGKVIEGYQCFLPGTVARAICAAIDIRGTTGGEPVPFSIEVWCEPDQEGRPPAPQHFSYVTYDRSQRQDNDPLLALAYASGTLSRPSPEPAAIAAPEEGTYDPETGEVRA
jgi:hypothetical protein